jgi:hypothetical protein
MTTHITKVLLAGFLPVLYFFQFCISSSSVFLLVLEELYFFQLCISSNFVFLSVLSLADRKTRLQKKLNPKGARANWFINSSQALACTFKTRSKQIKARDQAVVDDEQLQNQTRETQLQRGSTEQINPIAIIDRAFPKAKKDQATKLLLFVCSSARFPLKEHTGNKTLFY